MSQNEGDDNKQSRNLPELMMSQDQDLFLRSSNPRGPSRGQSNESGAESNEMNNTAVLDEHNENKNLLPLSLQMNIQTNSAYKPKPAAQINLNQHLQSAPILKI